MAYFSTTPFWRKQQRQPTNQLLQGSNLAFTAYLDLPAGVIPLLVPRASVSPLCPAPLHLPPSCTPPLHHSAEEGAVQVEPDSGGAPAAAAPPGPLRRPFSHEPGGVCGAPHRKGAAA